MEAFGAPNEGQNLPNGFHHLAKIEVGLVLVATISKNRFFEWLREGLGRVWGAFKGLWEGFGEHLGGVWGRSGEGFGWIWGWIWGMFRKDFQ